MDDAVPMRVQLQTDSARHVWAFDATGAKKAEIAATYRNRVLDFTPEPAPRSV